MQSFDVVVIGAGPGGYPAAIRAAQLGANVAIIEREFLGGTCLNWGCIPTKTLIASAEMAHHMKHADKWGVQAKNVSIDYSAMVNRKDEVVSTLRGGVGQLLKAWKVTVFEGTASFTGRNSIAISSKDETINIKAEKTIIATGTTSSVPAFIPDSRRVIESRACLDLTELPESMIVLGGGIIGCEFACMFAQLGVKVTIVELLKDILMMLDKDVRSQVKRVMKKDFGITLLTGKSLENITDTGENISGTFGGKEILAEMLLASVGRKPVTDGLALDAAGVKTDEHGYIPVDEYCQTNVPTIYAIGDVNGGPQLAHAATSQGIRAAENVVTGKPEKIEKLVPACIFTSPEVGSVGLSEQEAKELGREVKVGKFMFAALGKAMATGDTTGFVKWIADAETDQLLGAHAVGSHATDLIAEAVVAVRSELTAQELGKIIHSHPTYSEAWMEAAHKMHGTCIHSA